MPLRAELRVGKEFHPPNPPPPLQQTHQTIASITHHQTDALFTLASVPPKTTQNYVRSTATSVKHSILRPVPWYAHGAR